MTRRASGIRSSGSGAVELVQGGFQFTEGPQWREAEGDHRTLYITARTAVYRVRLAHPGLPRR